MKVNCSSANSVMAQPPVFVSTTDSLENNLKKMFKMCLKKIGATEKSTKMPDDDNLGLINPLIKKTYIKDDRYKIIAYQDSDMREILSIMKAMRLDSVPVVKHPWNKEFIGIVKKIEIENAIKGNSN